MGPTATVLRRAVIVWLVLVVATFASFFFGTDHPFSDTSVTIATTLTLVLALIKVCLIGLYFMEVRDAPTALRVGFGVWITVIGGVVLVLNGAS